MALAARPTGSLSFVRLAPGLTLAVLLLPIAFGLAATFLPAFGYLPALGGTELTLAHFESLFAMPAIWRSAALSLLTGVVTAGVSLLIVMLFVAGWAGTRTFARLQHAVSPLLAIPHAAAAFGLAFLIAPSGFLVRLAAPWAGIERPPDWLIVNDPLGLTMMAGLVAKEMPFLLLVTLAALPQVKRAETMQLVSAFGYGRIAGFLFTLWPQVYRQIRFAVYAVIAYATAVVDVAVILGPNLPAILPVRLLQWMNDPDLSLRFLASAGAVLQLGVTLGALLGWLVIEQVASSICAALRGRGLRMVRERMLRIAALAATGTTAVLVFGGIALLALWSFAALWQFPAILPDAFTLSTWQRALPRILEPLAVTLGAGALSTAIALCLTIACLEQEARTGRVAGRRAMLAIYLPLIVPQIAFVFGLQVLFLASGTDQRFAALVFVHLVFVLPYVFLSLSDPWRAFDRRYDLIAAGLGRSRLALLLKVRLPMLSRAVLTAAAVGFAVSVGQYLPTVLIGEGRLTTVTTEAVALAAGGNRRVIGVYAFLQTLLPFLAFAIASLAPALLWRNRRAMRP
ncbi:ABC transporter permease [Pararhizobium haloflavum]|uniref:ABC transporter permease n=1 Tax=Pararhizobium haloflavum TaxID=2037914 RepID=UPI000C1844EE|nr:ABC transporter permease [Pararhizobium haloflavum]